ncbi:MAG: hypothetical protein K6F81_05530 [Acholeplasmatales bacterium]|nr:hypothetical protein [Acholeplasmatales bacterium]
MDNTLELQKKIDDNEYVKIEKGVYVTAPLFLHSNMTLEIEEGAILLATLDELKYKDIKTRVAGIEMDWYPAIINAIDCENITIKGKGIIDGNGSYWYQKYWGLDMKGGMRKEYDSKGIRFLCDYDCKRPRNVLIQNSNNIRIYDVTSKDSGFWNIHVLYSKNVIISGVIIDSACNFAPSTDGIDIDSSNDILIENIIANTNDDSIAIKSGRDSDGIRVNRPSYDVEIRNCTIKNGFGITLGSELSAGIYDINIHDIKYLNTDCAFRIKSSNMRKGYVKNIKVNNLDCINVKYLFHINLNWNPNYNKCVIPLDYKGEIKEYYHTLLKTDNSLPDTIIDDIYISNVNSKIEDKYDGISRVFHLEGLDSSHIRNIYFDSINVSAIEYGYLKNVDNIVIKNSKIETKTDIIIKNNEYDNR